MPQLTATAILQLALLLSALPAQYLISQWTGASVAQRYHATKRLMVGLEEEEDGVPGESPAIEVMLHDNDLGFFGASTEVRSPRPPFVFLKVGEVVMERRGHMVGVVVSWDPELKAPQEWISRVYSDSEETKAVHTPHYKVLFQGPGPTSLMVAYLPQTQLERVTGMRPDIPTLEQYFTHFDGERFVMQPWLREIYPEDED
ncbi:uncharacterized protein FYW47_013349 [Aplochiton taeniatus]